MAVPERPLDTFRVLNGLSPNEPLLPGRKLKLVVE
jgi:predicted Zn-dependent protease